VAYGYSKSGSASQKPGGAVALEGLKMCSLDKEQWFTVSKQPKVMRREYEGWVVVKRNSWTDCSMLHDAEGRV
jgi:hypothetical protein